MAEEKYSRPLKEFSYYEVKDVNGDVLYMSNDYTHALEEMKNSLTAKYLVRITETTLLQTTEFEIMKGE